MVVHNQLFQKEKQNLDIDFFPLREEKYLFFKFLLIIVFLLHFLFF